jgi:hypothetical protein
MDESLEWIKKAEEELSVAKILFKKKEYPQALYYFQQVDEKLAKCAAISSGFLRKEERDQADYALEKGFGLSSNPIDWGHKWHIGFLKDAETFFNLIGDKNFEEKTKYKEKIELAKKSKLNPAPSLEELDATLGICNLILEYPQVFTIGLILPDKNLVIEKLQQRIEVNQDKKDKFLTDDEESHKEPALYFAVIMIVLAIINCFLSPYESTSRYPTKIKIEYGKLSIIQRFNEIDKLFKKCLYLIKEKILEAAE